jgi:hypothetical protein
MWENGTEGIDVGWMVGWIVDLISVEVGFGEERWIWGDECVNVRKWNEGGGVSRLMKSLRMEWMMGTVGFVGWVW